MPKKSARQTQSKAQERIDRTEAYANKVRSEFADAVNSILALNKKIPELKQGVMYSFDGAGKSMRREVDDVLRQLHSVTVASIRSGITQEWNIANKEVDELIASALGRKSLSNPKLSGWFERNEQAMTAFTKRTENGFNLSNSIWKDTLQLREEMEVAMTVAIGEGQSASQISRKVRQYLNDPDLMFRRFRYKDDDGEWQTKWKKKVMDDNGKYHFIDYDRDSYKTGAGVYKSSYRNAMRVARTETNMAYRRADNDRWSRLDFVLGQHIELSRSHPKEDICDDLQGDYPKDFLFEGWHPQCFCICTPILASEEDMEKRMDAVVNGEEYEPSYKPITTYPEGFQKFLDENREKIEQAKKAGTAPYFIENNEAVVQRRFEGEDLTGIDENRKEDEGSTMQERRDSTHLAEKIEDIDPKLRPKCGDLWLSASEDERTALWRYTDAGYEDVNTALREGKMDENGEVALIEGMIDKSTYDFDVKLRRGCGFEDLQKFGLEKKAIWLYKEEEMKALIGKEGVEDAFYSCGTSEETGNFRGNVEFEIFAPKGTKMMYCEPFTWMHNREGNAPEWDGKSYFEHFTREGETLLQRGTKFRVYDVVKKENDGRSSFDSYLIRVEIIGQNPVALS